MAGSIPTTSPTTGPTGGPRPPKLRASCDECGAAKLRCDRRHPDCGRCISLGLKCVYGVSRKVGKPRRDPEKTIHPRPPQSIASARGLADNTRSSISRLADGDNNLNLLQNSNSISDGDGTAIFTSGLFSTGDGDGMPPLPPRSSTSIMSIDGTDLPDPTWLDYTGDSFLDSTLFNPDHEYSVDNNNRTGRSTTAATPAQTHVQHSSNGGTDYHHHHHHRHHHHHHRNASVMSGMPAADGNDKDHDRDCFREAFDILTKLSFPTAPPSPSSSSPFSLPSSSGYPLDHLLGLSREATKRLSPLLSCSCARSPHLALLYAYIISRILTWYHQAVPSTRAGGGGSGSSQWDSSWSSPCPGSVASSIPGSATSMSVNSDKSPFSAGPRPPSTTEMPVEMAIGTFNVDDSRVQAAVQVQLLLGEIRRVGALIDQFASSVSNGPYGSADEDIIGGASSLYQSLDSWLQGKHSSLTTLTRSKLRELDS